MATLPFFTARSSSLAPLRRAAAIFALPLLASCSGGATSSAAAEVAPPADVTQQTEFAAEHPNFSAYWHAGLAEITRYRLVQTRYGAPREGDAVFVFVTEPFLPDAQVKHESADGAPDVNVLKLNAMRSFTTGVYPYNLMTSSFAPTEAGAALKVTATVTEWCGQAFAQLNRRNGRVEAQVRSYFEREGDADEVLEDAPYEDALWQRIRRNPAELPSGSIRLIPAMHALRLYHEPLRAYEAEVQTSDARRDGASVRRLQVRYTDLDRELTIDFEPAFPHAIVAFEEVHRGERSTGARTHSIMDAYWSHNGPGDEGLRDALGL
ncbi:MAG: septum formation inhibitor Maf [Myxococcota bacterium]